MNVHGNHKHLTLSDRVFIEQGLLQRCSFKSMADMLRKDPTTISKEIRLHAETSIFYSKQTCCWCKFFSDCDLKGNELNCPKFNKKYCSTLCKKCSRNDPTLYCQFFLPFTCNKTEKPPYVCNSCTTQKQCPLTKKFYTATHAQRQYEKTLVNSRKGINLTNEELQELNDLISPLIAKGQPLSHIFAVHADEIPVCRRTLYNYLDQRIFQVRNIDLPRRVRYKKRRKHTSSHTNKGLNQAYRNKRTYLDFERFMEAHPEMDVVEMDTVKGSRTSGKCLLTLLFRSCSFMLIILLPHCTQECVISAIDSLTNALGFRLFKKYFPVILTDNGAEFKDPYHIEFTPNGKRRCYVFYCDPYVSNQKARLEKNHEYIRYVIPKGRSMYKYSQEDINLLASHINSTARDSLNGATPFDLAELLLDKRIPALTGLQKVSPDSVMLKPALLEK